jgi:AICAR transformylase/IMP cyclohydrolase PurH
LARSVALTVAVNTGADVGVGIGMDSRVYGVEASASAMAMTEHAARQQTAAPTARSVRIPTPLPRGDPCAAYGACP